MRNGSRGTYRTILLRYSTLRQSPRENLLISAHPHPLGPHICHWDLELKLQPCFEMISPYNPYLLLVKDYGKAVNEWSGEQM